MKEEVKSYNVIIKNIDLEGYPVISKVRWDLLRENIPTNELKEFFVSYFIENKIPYPYPTRGELHAFNALNYIEKTNFTKDFTFYTRDYPNVYERVNNKNPYRDKPLMLMKFYDQYNIASNYFHKENRIKCSMQGQISAFDKWNDPKELFKCLRYIFSESNLQGFDVNKRMYTDMMRRCSGQPVTQSPIMSKLFYDMTKSEIILDIFPEWGDRLCGFYTSVHSKEYYCFEINVDMINSYKRQIITYENWMNGKDPSYFENDEYIEFEGLKKVRIYKTLAHLFDFEKLNKRFDIMFTENVKYYFKTFSKSNDEKKHYMSYHFLSDLIFKTYKNIQPFVDLIALDIHNYDKSRTYGDVRTPAEDDTIEYLTKIGYNWLGKAGLQTHKNAQYVKNYPDIVGLPNLKFVKPISFFHKDPDFDICVNEIYKNNSSLLT